MLVDECKALLGQLQSKVRLEVLDSASGKALPRAHRANARR
jgi:hypothetical protein